MHYIRLLSPIRLTPSNKQQPQISTKVAITTDLADAFLAPDQPIRLAVILLPQRTILTNDTLLWTGGVRALKVTVPVPRNTFAGAQATTTTICIAIAPGQTPPKQAGGVAEVMPVYAKVDEHTQHRRLKVGPPARGSSNDAPLEIEEQMGESIALHIWDTATAMLGLFERLSLFSPSAGGAHDVVQMPLLEEVLGSTKGVRILELGCGVGMLGLGLAQLLGTLPHRQGDVLLTDLPDAEETARANIALWSVGRRGPGVTYANLDWESVAAGQESGLLEAQGPWDLVVLSDCTYNDSQFGNLVATLDQVHVVGNRGKGKTRVLLGTKPRHESEAKFFGMVQEMGWAVVEEMEVPIKGVVGWDGEEQYVKIFLYEKGS